MKKIEEIERTETNQENYGQHVINRMDEIIKTVADALCCPERRLRGMTSKEWADFLEKREAENEKDRRNDVA